MNRRSLLALFGGGVASAASGVSVKEAAAQLGMSSPYALGETPEIAEVYPTESGASRRSDAAYKALRHLRDRQDSLLFSSHQSHPVSISTKRSWSPAFKDWVFTHDKRILDALIEKVEREEDFAEKLAAMIFGNGG